MERLHCKPVTILSLLQLLLFCNTLLATDIPPIYRLGIEKGLSNNSVRCIYKDRNGFMWFGTYDGLNRYDGYNFKIFRNKLDDSTSLLHNYIYSISEDFQNNLWIGTGQGLEVYNNLTGKFTPAFFFHHDSHKRDKITVNVTAVINDPGNNLLIVTNTEGLFVMENGHNTAVQVPIQKNGKSIYRFSVLAKMDSQKRIWLHISDYGLCTYDYKTKEVHLVSPELKTVHAIDSDNEGNLWIGTGTGLYQYSIEKKAIINSFTAENHKLTSSNVMCVLIDKKKQIWLGTEGGGINIVNPYSREVDYILPGEDQNSLTSENVITIFEDNEERKWIGTAKGGVNIIDVHRKSFKTMAHDPINKNSLINNFASAFYEDDNNNLWIGTDGGGMSIWDRQLKKWFNYKHELNNPSSLSSNSITAIKKDYLNNIWISTYGGGINKFNRATGTFEHYSCVNPATGHININVWQLFEGRDKIFWATTFSTGKLYLLNRQLNKFEVFNQKLHDLVSIFEDHDSTLWAGNYHQLVKIDKVSRQYIPYEIGKPVRSIFEDSKNRLWLGTEGGGLLLFDRMKGQIIKRFSEADGLCNNSVLNILEDNAGNLWLSTFNGLSRFNYEKKELRNFYQSDGLQSNQFLYNAALRLQDGELVFGGIKGFNVFFPDSITPHNYMPPVRLTNILVNNISLNNDSKYKLQTINDRFSEIKVPYNDASFLLEFAALEFSSPGKISYAYKMEGWDKDWVYTKSVRTVNYSNLREGSYLFRVKATNTEGAWNNKEETLQIIVLPPWYRTWWAYTTYVLLLIGVIYYYIQYKNKQTRLESALEIEKAVRERREVELALARAEQEKGLAELETQRIINETEREINEKRLSFFTSISHEFKTPLTLVINPVKDLLDKERETQTDLSAESGLKTVYRNARRMLSLIDQLLLFRKAESDMDTPRRERLNLFVLAKEVYLYFVQQARDKKIDFQFECTNEQLEIFADREKVEIILYNLLSNAFKYTSDNGAITLCIKQVDESVEIMVKDNGIGIGKEIGDRLFERFYQAPNAMSGFGIGLYLVKHFVLAHEGRLWYESEVGKGASFFVDLKIGKELFANLPEVVNPPVHLSRLPEPFVPKNNREPVEISVETGMSPMISEERTILIVDDNEEIRNYLNQIFSPGFKVYEASNGEEGLKQAHVYHPDIIISDVMMQGLNGIDLCKIIKQDGVLSHIPVILLTGNASAEYKLKGVEGGADDYITKPFEKELLVARVQSLLKNRSNLQNYFYNEITLQQNTFKISEEFRDFLNNCILIVERHLDDEGFTIKTLAAELGMSYSKMNKKIKAISGQPANAFIRFIRLRKAAAIFINTNSNVNETAYQVGIKDIKHFREHFHKLFGMNPSEYIDRYRNAFGKNYNLNEKIVK